MLLSTNLCIHWKSDATLLIDLYLLYLGIDRQLKCGTFVVQIHFSCLSASVIIYASLYYERQFGYDDNKREISYGYSC